MWPLFIRRDKIILSFPVTFQDFPGSVGRKKKILIRKILPVILGYRIIIFTENCQNFFWVGGFCHGSVGLQETTILFCPA